MCSRRQFLSRLAAPLLAVAVQRAFGYGQPDRSPARRVLLPLIAATPARGSSAVVASAYLPLVGRAATDMPIVGAPSGSAEKAIAWLTPRASGYTATDVATIVSAYQRIGAAARVDWFLALAQMAHETGHLSSWWSQRPRRNPAGIGVTGSTQAGSADDPPGPGWSWDNWRWREGWSFNSWANHAVPAHLGRLLAYALTDAQADAYQRNLIAFALAYRGLPQSYRGSAPTIIGLNGRWAVPGTTYGQSIIALVRRMRA